MNRKVVSLARCIALLAFISAGLVYTQESRADTLACRQRVLADGQGYDSDPNYGIQLQYRSGGRALIRIVPPTGQTPADSLKVRFGSDSAPGNLPTYILDENLLAEVDAQYFPSSGTYRATVSEVIAGHLNQSLHIEGTREFFIPGVGLVRLPFTNLLRVRCRVSPN